MKKFLLFCFSSIIVFGCAARSDVAHMKTDTDMTKRDIFELRKDISEIKKDIDELKEKSAAAVKEETFNSIRESEAQLRSEVSAISKELQTLTGRFDENKYFVDKTLKDKSSENELLRSQINSLETQIKEITAKLSQKSEPKAKIEPKKEVKAEEAEAKTDIEPKPQETKAPEIKEPAKLYEEAYNAFKEKKYKESRDKFEVFLKGFPKDKLSGNAQFWIAETYYAEEDYAGAIVEYDALVKNYPESDKSPGALLKQGYAFIEMGDKKAAKGILEHLREKYPKSKEAELAKKKIEEITKKGK